MEPQKTELLMYQTEDGTTKIEVSVQEDTVWLTQAQLCQLFQRDKSVISRHIRNIFDDGELKENSVVAFFATTAKDGKQYNVAYFNLDVIISVGYRVKSHRGTQFRIWATERLREYIVKGFTMNDNLYKNGGKGNYFEELLGRIRDIRSSEKVFWRKVLDIFATSIDYDPKAETSSLFFKTIQNKMHWAAHGHTAAEIIYERVCAELPQMGMTSFKGRSPTKTEAKVAKNYLNENELNILNRMVTAYLEFAELQALRQRPMYMKDWVEQLDDFLKVSRSDLLTHSGSISHDAAVKKAEEEYAIYRKQQDRELSSVDTHFIETIENTEKEIKKRIKKG